MCPVSTGMTDSSAGVRRPADTSVEQLERDEPNSRPGEQQETQLGAAPRPGASRAIQGRARKHARRPRSATGTRAGFRGNGPGVAPPLTNLAESPAQLGAQLGASKQGRYLFAGL